MTNLKPYRLLIIEDDSPISRMYVRWMDGTGFDVREAGTLAEGIAITKKWKPNLIILDLVLPDTVNEEVDFASIYNVTGLGDEQTFVDMLRAGAAEFLCKNDLTRISLLRTINRLLSSHEHALLNHLKHDWIKEHYVEKSNKDFLEMKKSITRSEERLDEVERQIEAMIAEEELHNGTTLVGGRE
jgi:DNA-binding response OmpR family regulator